MRAADDRSLALMLEADRSISDAFSTLTRTLQESEGTNDRARSTSTAGATTSLRTATYLLGDVRACLFTDSPLCVHQLIELVDVNVSTLDGPYRLAPAPLRLRESGLLVEDLESIGALPSHPPPQPPVLSLRLRHNHISAVRASYPCSQHSIPPAY